MRTKRSYFYPYHSTRSVKKRLLPQHINRLSIFPVKFMSFSGVSPLEKVKIIKSCGILILEKTENSLENVKRSQCRRFAKNLVSLSLFPHKTWVPSWVLHVGTCHGNVLFSAVQGPISRKSRNFTGAFRVT